MSDLPEATVQPAVSAEVLQLPECSPELLQASTIDELLHWMRRHEDRVPRSVIDECAQRGAAMTERLRGLICAPESWSPESSIQEDWLLVHAVHILGLQDSGAAGSTLIEALRQAADNDHDFLLDWIGGFWTALFRNKPASTLVGLQQLAADRSVDSSTRSLALEALLEHASRATPADLEQCIDQLAAVAGDATDDWGVRA